MWCSNLLKQTSVTEIVPKLDARPHTGKNTNTNCRE